MPKIETILVPMDFSTHSEIALDHAVRMGKLFAATIHLLHCHRIDTFSAYPYGPPYISDLPEDFDKEVRNAASKKLATYREKVEAQGVTVEQHLGEQAPAEAILTAADKIGADLIVMGTRGLTGLKHVVLGSVTERTLRAATCPVLCVKSEEEGPSSSESA